MAGIKKSSLVDQVYQQLKKEIITLCRPLGSRLNVSELQRELGVSCTPIREAMNRLQQEGLVVNENNIGVRVLSLTGHDVVEIQQLACTLHSKAIDLSMQVGDRKVMLGELEKHLKEYEEAKVPQEEVNAVHQFIGSFYRHCGNGRLDHSMLAIQGQQLLLRHMYAHQLPKRAADLRYYQEILEAVRRGDTEAVQTALQESTDKATEILLKIVDAESVST